MDMSVIPLRRAIPYINLYKGKAFIIKIGGKIIQEKANLAELAGDITLLNQVGISIILVHGGGPQATELCKKLEIEPKMINGRRITDEKTLEVAKMVYSGSINIDILTALRKCGTPAVGISGVDGNLITAKKREKKLIRQNNEKNPIEVDFGHVGDIEKVDIEILNYILKGNLLPVISSLGCDNQGNILNINADTIAEVIASSIKAEKLIMVTSADGLLKDQSDPSSLISYADIDEIEELNKEHFIKDGMLPKVDACLRALKNGVQRTHIINGARPGALLEEIFTNSGCGTMIVNRKECINYKTKELE